MPASPRLRLAAGPAVALLLALAGCKPPLPPQAQTPPGSPEEAVQRLAADLAQGNLAAFAGHAVPAGEHAVLDQAWRDGRSRWPLDTLPLDTRLVPLVQALAAPDAERQLGGDYDRQFAGQAVEIRQAVRTLAQFGGQYVQTEPRLDATDRAHYAQLIPALADWATAAPLADAPRAHQALRTLVASARGTGIHSEADLRTPGLDAGLARLTPFLSTLLDTAAGYGLDLRTSLTDLRTETAQVQGERAVVPVAYALAGAVVHTQVAMQRQDRRWYLASAMAQAQRLREAGPPASAPSLPPAPPADTAGAAGETVSTAGP